jgi:uncharacterized protein (TIGR00251 family)
MGATVTVRVVPNASREGVAGVAEGVVRIRLRAPAVEGKANRALVAFLAGDLGVRASAVRIIRGEGSRTKVISIEGLDGDEAVARLTRGIRG